MQMNITIKCHCSPIKVAIIKHSDNTKLWWGCWKTRSRTHRLMVKCKMVQHPLENNLAVSLKAKQTTTIQLNNCNPGHLPQRNEKLCSLTGQHMNVYSSLTCNSSKLEATQMSLLTEWMAKQTMEHPYHEILISNEKNRLRKHATNWMNCQRIMLSEKSPSQKVTYSDSIYMTFLKRQNYRNGEHVSNCQRLRRG